MFTCSAGRHEAAANKVPRATQERFAKTIGRTEGHGRSQDQLGAVHSAPQIVLGAHLGSAPHAEPLGELSGNTSGQSVRSPCPPWRCSWKSRRSAVTAGHLVRCALQLRSFRCPPRHTCLRRVSRRTSPFRAASEKSLLEQACGLESEQTGGERL